MCVWLSEYVYNVRWLFGSSCILCVSLQNGHLIVNILCCRKKASEIARVLLILLEEEELFSRLFLKNTTISTSTGTLRLFVIDCIFCIFITISSNFSTNTLNPLELLRIPLIC